MNEPKTYTLEELAEAFELTPRTARYYIEKVLPPHHKKGRGKLARYGQDTWNCFAFIQKVREQAGVTMTYLSEVLTTLDQEQINRVAEGREDLQVVTAPSIQGYRMSPQSESFPSASRRAKARRQVMEHIPERMMKSECRQTASIDFEADLESSEEDYTPNWQDLYTDDELRISHKGHADDDQCEQVRLAAKLIKKILSGKG